MKYTLSGLIEKVPVLTVALMSSSAGAGTSRPRMVNARCDTDYADEDVSVTARRGGSALQ